MFYNYLNNHEIYSHACNPSHFCDYAKTEEQPDLFKYEDTAKTILIGADESIFAEGEVTLPSTVKIIRKHAFYAQNKYDWSVIIPNNIEVIEEAAFRNSRLQKITFGTGLKTIGDYAFAYNTYCIFNQLPNTVESIGAYAFASCLYGKPSFTIPGSVTFMGEKIFGADAYWHPNSVIISNGVTEIGDNVFADLYTDSITLPSSLLTIGNSTFKTANCGNLIIPDSVTTIGDEAFEYYKGTSVTLPAYLTTIAKQLFFNSSITSIVIPNNVTSIGTGSFIACRQLTSITIPNSVTSIGEDAFYGCTFTTTNFINNSSAEGYPWGATIKDDVTE